MSADSPLIPPVDVNRLKETVFSSNDDFDELVFLYLKETHDHLQQLEEFVQVSSAQDVKTVAHGAAGASALLGMTAMGELFRRLEAVAAQNDLTEAHGLLQEAKTALARTEAYLRRIKAETAC
jgi:HPt (histidine-containing phosphotransfer) domain-containing protein